MAGHADNTAAIGLYRRYRRFHFSRLAAVGDKDHHIAGYELTAGAVDGLCPVQEISRRACGRKQGCQIARQMCRFPDTGDVQPVPVPLRGTDQLRSPLQCRIVQCFHDLLHLNPHTLTEVFIIFFTLVFHSHYLLSFKLTAARYHSRTDISSPDRSALSLTSAKVGSEGIAPSRETVSAAVLAAKESAVF